jgi:glycosyltransferase involved in cell wall biosynthesis
MRKITIFFLILLLFGIFSIGPYLPHPKRWKALMNKPEACLEETFVTNKISVIIPTYNDGLEMLSKTINTTIQNSKKPELLEIIVVDGGSKNQYVNKVEATLPIKTTIAEGGRGPSLNAGIKMASGEIILMLHADCLLEKGFDKNIHNYFSDPKVIMTAFEFYADSSNYPTMNSIENRVNARSKYLWLPYGDQAIAVRKVDLSKYFNTQIPNYKMMEDFELVWRMRDIALDNNKLIAIIPQKVLSSPRRFLKKGPIKTVLLNWLFVTGYVWGNFTPDQIFYWYYTHRSLKNLLIGTSLCQMRGANLQ